MKKFSLFLMFAAMSVFAFADNLTSLSVGDNVIMINADASKEFGGIAAFGSNKAGEAVDFTGTPAGVAPLEIVAGSADGSIAFKTGDEYLAWTSGNTLITAAAINESSSWTVTFDGNDATIANVGTPERILSYNATNPRFACYGNMNQKRVQFFSAGAVTPPTPVDVESITLSESSLELVEGQKSAKLTVTYAPANANQGKSVTWASSDEAVATVADGVVTAVAVGTATITATTPNGKSASCAVTVKEKPAPSGNLATSLAVGDVVVMINSDASKEFNGISGTYGAAEDYSGDPAGLHPLTIVAGSADGSIAFQDGDAYLAWTSGNSLTTASEVDASSSWVVTFESNDATIANVGTPERILSYNAGSPRFACYGNMNQKRVQFFSAGAVTPVAKITANPASVSFNVTLEDNIAQAEQAVEIKAQNIANEISISIQGAPEITVEPNQLAKDGGIITVKLNASEEGEYSSKITLSAKNDEGADVVATIEVSAKVKEKATPVTGEGFIKVTEALNDWSGTYLIVYE